MHYCSIKIRFSTAQQFLSFGGIKGGLVQCVYGFKNMDGDKQPWDTAEWRD